MGKPYHDTYTTNVIGTQNAVAARSCPDLKSIVSVTVHVGETKEWLGRSVF
jgi:hypothetical protein